jgi:hypothetical protein
MEEADVVVMPAAKRAKVESEKPPADGDLTVTVHVVSINHLNTAFSKTKRCVSFVVKEASQFLSNINRENFYQNLSVAKIGVENLHSLVIRHFGEQTKNVIDRVTSGLEPRLLNSIQNTATPDYGVSFKLQT